MLLVNDIPDLTTDLIPIFNEIIEEQERKKLSILLQIVAKMVQKCSNLKEIVGCFRRGPSN